MSVAPTAAAIAADRRLDAGDAKCGELLLMMHRAMQVMQADEVLDVAAYSAGNILDVPAWCRLTGHPRSLSSRGSRRKFFIRKKEG